MIDVIKRVAFLLQGIFIFVWIFYEIQGLALPKVLLWLCFPLYALSLFSVACIATVFIYIAITR